jgi:hypothetical protein
VDTQPHDRRMAGAKKNLRTLQSLMPSDGTDPKAESGSKLLILEQDSALGRFSTKSILL